MKKKERLHRNGLIIRQYWHGAPIEVIAEYWNLSIVTIYKIIKTSR